MSANREAVPRADGARRPWLRRACALLAVVLASGCAIVTDPFRANLSAESKDVQSCAAWFQSLEGAIDRSGVRDAGSYRIPGFPYFRVDRFLASFRHAVQADDAAFRSWTTRLRRLDANARGFELLNLPDGELPALGVASRNDALVKAQYCAGELQRHDLANAATRDQLIEQAQVPDDYSEWQRAFLYPIARIPFAQGVNRWHERVTEMFREGQAANGEGQVLMRYVATKNAPPTQAIAIVARTKKDELGIPILSAAQREILFAAHAPVFQVETSGEYDRPGFLVWRGDAAPGVDTSRPTVYRRMTHTRYGNETFIQLVYTLWFPERPHDDAFDLLAGKLDGVVVRVTLAPDGEPLVYDTIHPCGCYHMFFPTARVRPNPAPDPTDEWALIPTTLPMPKRPERLVLRIASRTHYVTAAGWEADPRGTRMAYVFEEEEGLRSLSTEGGGRRSLYGPDGLVPGSERAERWLFWPMGIASSGTMRQWGRHATAFLGRRHFDDADLIEKRFTLLPH